MPNLLHLYMVGSTYYCRCRIPKDLMPWFDGIIDHKRTLKTKNLSRAQSLLRIHSSRTEMTFTMMRSGIFEDAQLRLLAEEYINHGSLGCKKTKRTDTDTGAGVNNEPSNQTADMQAQKVNRDTLLSTIVEKYIQEYKDTENIGSTTAYELETKCRQFARVYN